MVELSLEEFEKFYNERLNDQFFKIRRAIKKIIETIRLNLIEIKVCMDHFMNSIDHIDQKSQRSLQLFYDRIKVYVDDIQIPEEDEINHDNLRELITSIKKLFININEIARKSLPKFQKEVQPQIKELNYISRKLGKRQTLLEQFLRKKYTDVKNAEELLKKLPKLFTLRENIEHSKADLDIFEKEFEERKEDLEKLNKTLIELEKDELFRELDKKRDDLFKLRMTIDNEIGFKKALKKLKFELEKETIHISNFDNNYLRDFLKNPIKSLANESKDLPKFSALLVHLRHTLEESNKLNLKTDTKDKTIEQINVIFDDRMIYENIEKYREFKKEVKQVEEKINEAGLAAKFEEVKNQISINTVKLEHIENDLNRKNKDYMKYLGTLKQEREDLQKLVENVIQEPVKINITLEF
jgi:hypothetical protein